MVLPTLPVTPTRLALQFFEYSCPSLPRALTVSSTRIIGAKSFYENPSLQTLTIPEGVVTIADKASGRGLKVNESAVKKYAVEHNIPVLQPISLKDPEFLDAIKAWKPDLFVVVAPLEMPASCIHYNLFHCRMESVCRLPVPPHA